MRTHQKFAAAGIAVVLTVGITSAAVLSSYGTVTGAADVQPSLEITDVDTENDEVTVENMMDREFDLGEYSGELVLDGTVIGNIDANIMAGKSSTFNVDDVEEDDENGAEIRLELDDSVIYETDQTYSEVDNNEG